MKRLVVSLLLLQIGLTAGITQKPQVPTLVIDRPTVIAFFPPVTEAELEKNPDMNEVLSDFQEYAYRAGPRLKKAGIDFQAASAVSFKIRNGGNVSTFKTGKNGVGYYFIAPGRKPHVEYGVHDDVDILDLATKYFHIPIPTQ